VPVAVARDSVILLSAERAGFEPGTRAHNAFGGAPVDRLLLARIVTRAGLAERLFVPGRGFELRFLAV